MSKDTYYREKAFVLRGGKKKEKEKENTLIVDFVVKCTL